MGVGHRRTARLFAVAAVAVLVAGCRFGMPSDPARIPDGPVDALDGMPEPIGPITELGRGTSLGVGWRYHVYESNEGACSILELGSGAGGTCGFNPAPDGDSALVVSGVGSTSGAPSTIEGWAGEEVAAVWIELEGGERIAATLLPLDPVGEEGQVFVAIVPENPRYTSAVAVDPEGVIISRQEIP